MTDRVVRSIQDSYDRLADEYTRRIYGELRAKPFDRDLLDRFAADVTLSGAGPPAASGPAARTKDAPPAKRGEACDMGCGPGQVARYLKDAGAAVFGLDLSPRMVEQARRLNPDIVFREGNMLALDLPDGTLAGIAAFYAIVNLPASALPVVFQEMTRVLRPGGLLLLAFHAGSGALHERELWGRPIDMDFFLFEPAAIRRALESAGLVVEEVLERDPYAPEVEYQSRRAYIFARKPAGPRAAGNHVIKAGAT